MNNLNKFLKDLDKGSTYFTSVGVLMPVKKAAEAGFDLKGFDRFEVCLGFEETHSHINKLGRLNQNTPVKELWLIKYNHNSRIALDEQLHLYSGYQIDEDWYIIVLPISDINKRLPSGGFMGSLYTDSYGLEYCEAITESEVVNTIKKYVPTKDDIYCEEEHEIKVQYIKFTLVDEIIY